MFGSEPVVDPTARDKYLLQVTAGPSYDASTHKPVLVNNSEATLVESDLVTAWVKVRIKDYNGLPRDSPPSSTYFDHRLHKSDLYSIGFSFVPKCDIAGKDLVMGFDYDHSIKHQLPPGFRYAMRIVTSFLDPGLYSDPYSDEPYLYGPALSSFFAFSIGERTEKTSAKEQLATLETESDGVVEEGASGSGQSIRDDLSIPPKWKKRRKHFLSAPALENFTFEKGRMYHADFFNPHLDFANFSLRLPGFSISIARYIDEKTHHLRFVLKNRETGDVAFTVFMKLLFGQELEDRIGEEGESPKESGKAKATEEPVARDEKHGSLHEDAVTARPKSSQDLAELEIGVTQGQEAKKGVGGMAASTVDSLTNSIYGVYAALGFAKTASSSPSEASSRVSSPQPSNNSVEARIDEMDDSTIEAFLQSRQGNTS